MSFIKVRRLVRGGLVIKCEEPKDYVKLLKPWPPQAFNGVKLNIHVQFDSNNAGLQNLPNFITVESTATDILSLFFDDTFLGEFVEHDKFTYLSSS